MLISRFSYINISRFYIRPNIVYRAYISLFFMYKYLFITLYEQKLNYKNQSLQNI